MINIKWRFGEVCLTMTKEQILEWRPRILEAFEGIPANCTKAAVSSRTVGVQTDDYHLQCDENDALPMLSRIPEDGGCSKHYNFNFHSTIFLGITELPNTPPKKLSTDATEDEGYDTYHNSFSSAKSCGGAESNDFEIYFIFYMFLGTVGFASGYYKVPQQPNHDQFNQKDELRTFKSNVFLR